MNRLTTFVMLVAIAFSFIFHMFGMMNLYPAYITAPLLYFSIFLYILSRNHRNRFKGFK
ncbi:hypothetical protein [Fervidibacillus halotolerans]|uniref:Uncharacterized protein n=1 Tax=Fervidibacillus halotolerans TaxID=2980027 RepID=A0A9E8M0S7_9BACI|nr:hypothetical protein [Fervidibacillus halotolerans]WAA13071.1 hypothetical protein OE105_02790 [Fervidibacillus halotolerans]